MTTIDNLKKSGFSFKKSLGQNFLTDTNLLNAIASDAGITSEDFVVEIGAGAGTLTNALAQKAAFVLSFEVDRQLLPFLADSFKDTNNVAFDCSDILKLDKKEFAEIIARHNANKTQEFKVAANLPYYITTPLIFYFLESELNVKSLTIMVQREVAERMCARAGSSQYGALSLAVAHRCKAKITRIVSKNMFTPSPKVDSAVVHLEVVSPLDKSLSRLIKSLFAMRRKTAVNNIMGAYSLSRERVTEAMEAAGLSVNIRGEQLNLEQVCRLNDCILQVINK